MSKAMKKVVFVSIDKPKRWGEWHQGPTDDVYHSGFFSTEKQSAEFLEQVKKDYPDSNLSDGKGGHEYHIKHVCLSFDASDKEGFDTLCRMMRAYDTYQSPIFKEDGQDKNWNGGYCIECEKNGIVVKYESIGKTRSGSKTIYVCPNCFHGAER